MRYAEAMLGERLAEARRRAGLTQAELAEALGDRYDQTTISAVERGRSSLRLDGVVRVARALNLSVDWLLGLTDAPFDRPGFPSPDTELALNFDQRAAPSAPEPSRGRGVPSVPEPSKVESVEIVRDRRLAELLAALMRHWEALGTPYARKIWIADIYRSCPALRAQRSVLRATISWLGWQPNEGRHNVQRPGLGERVT